MSLCDDIFEQIRAQNKRLEQFEGSAIGRDSGGKGASGRDRVGCAVSTCVKISERIRTTHNSIIRELSGGQKTTC